LKAISANIDCSRPVNEMKKIESECFKEFIKINSGR